MTICFLDGKTVHVRLHKIIINNQQIILRFKEENANVSSRKFYPNSNTRPWMGSLDQGNDTRDRNMFLKELKAVTAVVAQVTCDEA